ncbi:MULTISPECIES: hypothetical protein [Roseateles]|jgi:hypothetical protein|uniref:Uncharacterized protein n=2 Tax=Roseateles TaxID=93681 RepID=A0A0U3L044_9BURK|nr:MULTISPECIES: hypothetical protein [Roseateles]ALV04702.1 hypothetical protein RD2015_197 [Roseateles depolymerans]MBB3194917.1 hypothetical protein [Roseateles terrae]REG15288.1 hypothetical protein DES44_3795 [Roseateles depolymerans]WAC73988.1 hypothetical protein OU995_04440 [Roseateles sp. SL47]
MSVATQTFGLPVSRTVRRGGTFATIGARVWARSISNIKARLEAARIARSERELLSLAAQYEESMPSFAAELRAAYARRNNG